MRGKFENIFPRLAQRSGNSRWTSQHSMATSKSWALSSTTEKAQTGTTSPIDSKRLVESNFQ